MGSCDPIVDGVAGGGSLPSALTNTWSLEDFRGREVSSTSAEQGYLTGVQNGATAAVNANVDANHPGTIQFTLATTASSGATKRQEIRTLAVGALETRWQTCLQFDTLPSAGEDYMLFHGLYRQVAGLVEPTAEGIYFYADRNNANWQCKTIAGGVPTAIDSGVAVAAGAWINFEIRATSAAVAYFIDGAAVGTIATNIPSATLESAFTLTRFAAVGAGNIVYVNDFVYWQQRLDRSL